MLAKSALGRSFAVPLRHRSAYPHPLRARLTNSSKSPASSVFSNSTPNTPFSPLVIPTENQSSIGKHFQASQPRSKYSFATMHRSPAVMVTKPSVDPHIEIRTPRDPNTLSNYHNYVTRHTSVDFDIDFSKKRLFGSVVLRLESLTDEDVNDVVLDCRYV
jgi:leukotriene-A4 hydrolase